MKKNMGTLDRVLRIAAALAVIALYFTPVISGTIAIMLLVIAGIFIVTGFVSFCPLYYPFNLRTSRKQTII